MASPSQKLSAFQARVAEIESMYTAGEIGPATRRALLERARDTSGVAEPLTKIAPPKRAQSGKDIGLSRDSINAAKRAGRKRHDYPVG